MKAAGRKTTKTQPPRTGYDRLVGPMRLVPYQKMWLLNPDESVALTGQWGLAPDVGGGAWRIENVGHGRETSEVLYRRVAALEKADEERIREEASSIGAFGPPGAAIDVSGRGALEVSRAGMLAPPDSGSAEDRAKELLARLRTRLREGPRREPATPLATYPEAHDPRVFWRMSESTLEMIRDGGVTRDIVDAVEHFLEDFELPAADHAAIAAVARAVAKRWRPAGGCASLYELTREELEARGQRALDTTWPRVVALVLIERAGARPLLAWRGLGMITPLLLAIVGPRYRDEPPRGQENAPGVEGASCRWPQHDLHADVRAEPVASWLNLAREARAWRDVIEELRKGGLGRRLGGVERMKTAFDELRGALFGVLNDFRPYFDRVDAHDGATLWQKFAQLFDRRLEATGLTSMPAGVILGTHAHMLLAIQRAIRDPRLCPRCGAPAEVRGLCRPCYRESDRDSHRRRRAKKSAAGGRAKRQATSATGARRAPTRPRKRRLSPRS